MKVVVAMDSLKGSLRSMEAGLAVKEGIHRVNSNIEVIVKPLADGGEGTTEALVEGLGGEWVTLTVEDPLKRPVTASYGYLKEKQIAIIEMASAAGLTLLKEEEKDPLKASTYGVGQLIKDAINKGVREFIIGIGGSATNDGGIGMLTALGYTFLDENKKNVGEGGQALEKVAHIIDSPMKSLLTQCKFQVACDVNNPLYGPKGATYIYGPQKGVTPEIKAGLDKGMKHFSSIATKASQKDLSSVPGTGAAGGLGFAFLHFLKGELTPGVQLILDITHLEKDLKNTDIVITGEGQLDKQTAMGKAPIGVASLAKKHNISVIAFAGSVTKDASLCNKKGIDAFFPIMRGVSSFKEALNSKNAKENIADSVEQVFRLLQLFQK